MKGRLGLRGGEGCGWEGVCVWGWGGGGGEGVAEGPGPGDGSGKPGEPSRCRFC